MLPSLSCASSNISKVLGTVYNTMVRIPETHPRRESLLIRERLIEGFHQGLVSEAGLIAHGRGEALDYLLGEETPPEAAEAVRAAAAMLLLAKHPVISVNGNVAALCPREVVRLAEVTQASIEVNIFYRTEERVQRIAAWLYKHGAKEVLGTDPKFREKIPELQSERRWVDRRGIWRADVVLLALEDGDRTEALRRLGKQVIAIDLNPLSRTARAANITIVDNVVRALPALIQEVEKLRTVDKIALQRILSEYDNELVLRAALRRMCSSPERLRMVKIRER